MSSKLLLTLLLSTILTTSIFGQSANELPFSNGVNLTNWFQAASPQQIDFSKYTKKDFENIKSLGADVVRLPINLHSMTGGAPDYTLDPLFLFFLDQVVDWTEELEIHLILDNHTFDPIESTDPDIGDVLNPVWLQMATHFKDRTDYIYFEVLNEPHGISNEAWNAIQLDVINTIRTVDTKHTIIVGPSDYNGLRSLEFMPEYADTNLIYTFHFYDPFVLTHQGANWTDPSLAVLGGIPFPYSASDMPSLPSSLAGTWVQGAFNNYQNEGTVAKVREYLDIAVSFAQSRGVPVFCGEFGVYAPNSDNDSRVEWYGTVSDYLTENGIMWTIWDYQGGFGIFEPGSNELFEYDINEPLVEALGFKVPDQQEFVSKPDSVGFDVYLDYIGSGMSGSHNSTSGALDFYFNQFTYDGEFSIFWSGASQYNHIGFDFAPNKDLSALADGEYALDFWIAGSPASSFDIRFIDTKTTDEGDRPWRMNTRVDASTFSWDGTWQNIRIPLADFWEMGSWDEETWFNPQGDFDWSAVDVLQFVAEEGNMEGVDLAFDNIRIIDTEMINSTEQHSDQVLSFQLNQNYPNPFNPSTTISFEISELIVTSLSVFDAMGREVAELVNSRLAAGTYSITFDGSGLASGIYFYKLTTGSSTEVKKMILLK